MKSYCKLCPKRYATPNSGLSCSPCFHFKCKFHGNCSFGEVIDSWVNIYAIKVNDWNLTSFISFALHNSCQSIFVCKCQRAFVETVALSADTRPLWRISWFYLPAPRNAFARSLLCLCKCSRSGLRVSLTNSSKKQQNLQHNEVFSRNGSGISIRVATEFKSSNFHSLTS